MLIYSSVIGVNIKHVRQIKNRNLLLIVQNDTDKAEMLRSETNAYSSFDMLYNKKAVAARDFSAKFLL